MNHGRTAACSVWLFCVGRGLAKPNRQTKRKTPKSKTKTNTHKKITERLTSTMHSGKQEEGQESKERI